MKKKNEQEIAQEIANEIMEMPALSMRRKIALHRDWMNYELGDHPKDFEKPSTKPPITRPNGVDDIGKLVERFIKGREVPLQDDPYYNGDLPDVDKMSKTEKADYGRAVRKKIAEAQAVIDGAMAESRKRQIADQQAEIERLKSSKTSESSDPPPH